MGGGKRGGALTFETYSTALALTLPVKVTCSDLLRCRGLCIDIGNGTVSHYEFLSLGDKGFFWGGFFFIDTFSRRYPKQPKTQRFLLYQYIQRPV